MIKSAVLILCFIALNFAESAENENNKVPAEVDKIYQTLITGTLEDDIVKFHSVCDAGMKNAITKKGLTSVNESIGKLVSKESPGKYIGYYMKNGIEVHLYKIIQKEKMDDLIVLLSIKDDKCVGLLFQ